MGMNEASFYKADVWFDSLLLRWEAPGFRLQSQWGVVWSPNQKWPRVGPKQLHHTSQQSGETFLVPRARVPQRSWVPAEQRDQRQLLGPGEREQSWPAVHLAEIRREGVPLQNQHCFRWQGTGPKPGELLDCGCSALARRTQGSWCCGWEAITNPKQEDAWRQHLQVDAAGIALLA